MREECGVFGIYDHTGDCDVAGYTYLALYALQHRGQESCGIAVNVKGKINWRKDKGLVFDVFNKESLGTLGRGRMAIGHVQASTVKTQSVASAQPLIVKHIKGPLAVAHNGAIANAGELREELELQGAIFHSPSDSEVIAYIITKMRLESESIQSAVEKAMTRFKGAYSIIIMSAKKIIAIRDPDGFRPLCMGKIGDGQTVFASETCAFDSIGAEYVRDILPGEIVLVDENGVTSIKTHCSDESKKGSLCVFEYVYFARPDSVLEGQCVHSARQKAGEYLAVQHPAEADVVIGIPDSGLDAALGFSKKSGIDYGVGFIKNRYVGRTFIQPTQTQREDSVKIKLNVLASTVKNKRVVLIDDSIVRGTTIAGLVRLLRGAGAAEVHVRISSPPFLYPCYFGTDVDNQEKLIAHNMSIENIRKHIGADSLGFLAINDIKKIASDARTGFCIGCFSGEYPIEVPAKKFRDKFDAEI